MFKKPTIEQSEAMRLYADLLEEAKVRIDFVETALNGKHQIAGPLLHEMCFLQLRILCEIIALGCLVVHGDIKATQKNELRKEWKPPEIIERLEKIHSAFYPIPHEQTKTDTGYHLTDLTETSYLTRADLAKLWETSGSHLHRGNLKKLLKSRQPTQFNFPDIFEQLSKIGKLLSTHRIPLFEEGTLLIATLKNVDDNNRVQVAFASAPFEE